MIEGRACGKLLLCGEYAALFGCDALGIGVQSQLRVRILSENCDSHANLLDSTAQALEAPQALADKDKTNFFHIDLTDLSKSVARTQASKSLVLVVDYLVKQLAISASELCVAIDSEIDQNKGFGSSAALCCALFRALRQLSPLDRCELENKTITILRQCEDYFHGVSSGIDTTICWKPGVCKVKTTLLATDDHNPRFVASLREDVPGLSQSLFHNHSGWGWAYIDSGTPRSSTQECVQFVLSNSQKCREYAQSYPHYLNQLLSGIENENQVDIYIAISHMHQSLCHLGIVPQAIQVFVSELQTQGCCAKISGAGCIRGDAAGILIAYGPIQTMHQISQKYNFSCRVLSTLGTDLTYEKRL